MTRHDTDPPERFDAADKWGKIVAQGLMSHAEAMEALTADPPPGADPGGMAVRIAWTLADSVRRWETVQSRAEAEMRKRCRVMADTQKSEAILAALHALNEQFGQIMLRHQMLDLLRDELAVWLRFNARRRKRAR